MVENPHERRAQALAEITQMQTDLVAANERVAFLESQLRDRETILTREINRQEARADVAEQDRAMYRAEAHLYRGKLVELATSTANIGKLTEAAQKIAGTVNSLLTGETSEQAQEEQDSAREMVTTIDQLANKNGPAIDFNDIEDEMSRLLGKGATAPAGDAIAL